MIMSFLTFFLGYSQLFSKGKFPGLNSLWRPLTFHRHGQKGRLLGSRLSISSSLVFYNKMTTLEIEFHEDLRV